MECSYIVLGVCRTSLGLIRITLSTTPTTLKSEGSQDLLYYTGVLLAWATYHAIDHFYRHQVHCIVQKVRKVHRPTINKFLPLSFQPAALPPNLAV